MPFHMVSLITMVGQNWLLIFSQTSLQRYNTSSHDPRFEGFSIPSLKEFVGNKQEEMLSGPVRAVKA